MEEEKSCEIGCCLGLPLFLVGAILSVPFTWVAGIIQLFQEQRFQKQMQEQGRFIAWNDLVAKIDDGRGTIIVEGQNKMPHRVWWTAEDVPDSYTEAIPTEQELYEISMDYFFTTETSHPFVEWCFGRYLSPDAGLAYLTEPPQNIMEMASGFSFAQAFKSKFPKIAAVDTVRKA